MEVAESTEKAISRPTNSYTEFTKLGWISKFPMPMIGAEVNVKINGIGNNLKLNQKQVVEVLEYSQ